MKVICEQEGNKLHTSVQYSPESNGVTNERLELHDSSPPNPCGQKLSTPRRLYIIGLQRRHWAVVRHVRPFTGRNRMFRTFVGTERSRKLDDRARICFFVGYKYEGGGYQVWDPKRRVVVDPEI